MIKKNILAIALLSVFGVTNAADVDNLRTTSYLNEPLRLQADVIGEGEIKLASPTEYLRLNHPIPRYDLSIDIVEQNGQRQLILVTTEEIESPALTLLLESNDANNRKQIFELPILLDFKPEVVEEPFIEITELDEESSVEVEALPTNDIVENTVETAEVLPEQVAELEPQPEVKVEEVAVVVPETNVELAAVPEVVEVPKVEVPIVQEEKPVAVEPEPKVAALVTPKAVAEPKKAPVAAAKKNNDLIKRYGPVAKGETLWSIANKVRPSDVTPQKMIEIIKANNPRAFSPNGVLLANVTLVIPGKTEEVQHQFVKADEQATNNDRVAFIYELPAPPVTVKTIAPEAAPEETTTEAAEPVVAESDQDFLTLAPEPVEEVASPSSSASIQEPVAETANVGTAPIVSELPVETASSTGISEPAQNVAPVTEQAQPPVTEVVETAIEAPVQVEAPAPVEAPPKRPIYIVPDPEPEPGIVELIFENIMYIGAAALVIILAILMIVLRRRKKDDEPKQPKKLSLKKDKKKDGKDKVEEVAIATAAVAAVVASAEAAKPVAEQAVITEEVVTKDEATIESLDFDLNFNDLDSSIAAETEVTPQEVETIEALDFAITSAEEAPAKVEESIVVEETPEYSALDFDLSSTDDSDLTPEVANTVDTAEESFGGLDFTLSPIDSVEEPVDNTEETTEEYGGLDFTLSTTEPTEAVIEDEAQQKTEDYDGLDFDLSSFSVEEENTASQEGFGENNPLFSSKNYPDAETEAVEENESMDLPEYISFPDLLDTASSTLIDDVAEADKPQDFASLLEDHANDISELISDSANSSVEKNAKMDLSFIADTTEEESGAAFLNSLDFSTEPVLEDPIDNSVRTNIEHSEESLEELNAINASPIEMPEIIETEIIDEQAAEFGENTIELASFDIDALESAPEVVTAPTSISDHLLEEDVIDFPSLNLEVSEEPEIEKLAQSVETTIEEPSIEIIEPLVLAEIEEPIVSVEEVQEIAAPVADVGNDEVTDGDFESEQVKLELAVAYMDFDKSLAKPLLDEVVRDGNPSQIAKAKELLASIN